MKINPEMQLRKPRLREASQLIQTRSHAYLAELHDLAPPTEAPASSVNVKMKGGHKDYPLFTNLLLDLWTHLWIHMAWESSSDCCLPSRPWRPALRSVGYLGLH